ncbi:pyridoxamine 5'-phosphate oxidase [Flavobacterium sp. 316]|uniref:Pyridoxine/pyridoxamine 5'-phosphate oxidase n=1 Tax=Flavobacterium sediminilitoris TaxID=2024526 RepID=A0ABY4HKQ9_9FLAO|nr:MULTISPECIES: pyridoxamine 5'-phosphate oxidase [Flavobacterium]KIX20148.1 pyridoxamine 5'-phosphate oxidase [Flavobacterium sp. 316]UOX33158.1 pyridoxamine 5'-phosphate oxidase [Flavobacterium sediminilitoris]
MKDLGNYRKSYEKSELLESNIPEDPINLFNRWFHEVEEFGGVDEVNAMTVATIGLDGFPKSRVVLLKKFNEEGFIFYTNYTSEKGKAILSNPNICLSFFWHSMERQIIIKGVAEKTSPIISDNYFASRPDGSKLGAIVSDQSEVIPNRQFLEDKLKSLEKEFEGKIEIPRPEFWGGFLVKPVEVEFWQGRPNRLHDRIRYKLSENSCWNVDRLSP